MKKTYQYLFLTIFCFVAGICVLYMVGELNPCDIVKVDGGYVLCLETDLPQEQVEELFQQWKTEVTELEDN